MHYAVLHMCDQKEKKPLTSSIIQAYHNICASTMVFMLVLLFKKKKKEEKFKHIDQIFLEK